ncbi:hypothetical protein BHE74_00015026 [Ensete ventricosum]|nr:hypothetical protein BHE74_00015026 [Ensete ventricosum]
MNSFWTSFSHRFTCRNYAQRESVESEERVSGSRRLGMEALRTGVKNPTATYGVPDLTSGGKRYPLASAGSDGNPFKA